MDLKISRNSIIGFCGLSLLLLMIIFVSQAYEIKIILMFSLLLLIKKKRNYITSSVQITYLLIFVYGLYGLFFGVLYQTENPFIFATIYFIYPTFFLVSTFFLDKDRYFDRITRIIYLGHVFIVCYDIFYAFSIFYGFYFPNIYKVEIPFSIYENETRMNFVNLNTLTFTTPAIFVLFLGNYKIGISRTFQVLVLVFTFLLFIISGRRSVMLISLILPFLPFFFSRFFSKTIKNNMFKGSIIFLVLTLFVFLNVKKYNLDFVTDYSQVFLKAFDSDVEPIKFAQGKMLFEKFLEKPFFGHGFGSMFYEPSPGRMVFANQFELSYHFKLASTGILGFCLIIGTYVWILFHGFYISKKNNDLLLFSFILGYFFMLIADATNPVLSSFDLIWPIYLCLARVNYWNLQTKLNLQKL